MHISQIRTFETKEDYDKRYQDNPKLPATERAYTTAFTNKIILKDTAIDCINKILSLLIQQEQYIGFVMVRANESSEDKKSGDAEKYHIDLHRRTVSAIRNTIGNHNPDDYIQYERWHDKDNDRYAALFVQPSDNKESVERLKSFAEDLDCRSEVSKSSDAQQLLNCLLSFLVKIALINDLEVSRSAINAGHVNLNNALHFLVKQGAAEAGKAQVYHALLPNVWVTSQNEVVCTLMYQRFKSLLHNSQITESQKVDVFIPNNLPSSFNQFKERRNNNAYTLIKENAGEGTKGIDFIDISAIDQSAIYYETAFSKLIGNLCDAAEINHKVVEFRPNMRGRPWGGLNWRYEGLEQKPKLTIIVAVNQHKADETNTVTTVLVPNLGEKDKSKPKNKDKDESNTIKFECSYTNQECVDWLVSHMKESMLADYEVDVVNFNDIDYSSLQQEVSYVVLQDPKPTYGYWYFADKEKEAKLIELYGENWRDYVSLGFKDSNIPIQSKWDMFKILRFRDSKVSRGDDSTLFTDPYTSLKLKQYDRALAGKPKITLQGMHIPKYEDVAKSVLAQKKYESDITYDEQLKVKNGDSASLMKNIGLKINIDLQIKALLANRDTIKLYDVANKPIDYSRYAGKYRCYYVSRPSQRGRDSFYASQLDIEVTKEGIDILDVKILDNDSSIRAPGIFSIGEQAIERLYDNGFYIINEQGDILTSYTNKREPRILSTIPQSGSLDGLVMSEWVFKELEKMNFEPGSHVKIRRTTLKGKSDAKGGISPSDYETSGYLSFHIRNSDIKASGHGFRRKRDNGKTVAFGGHEWLFIEENELGEVLTYITDKRAAAAKTTNATRAYRILVKDKEGNTINASRSALTGLYIETTNFHVNLVNSFSSKSILSTIAKIALKD